MYFLTHLYLQNLQLGNPSTLSIIGNLQILHPRAGPCVTPEISQLAKPHPRQVSMLNSRCREM
jgi:hypothetical protein